ncbi:murein biosynthesis integral membrane protein MurJ [Actinocorallia populi]|uniref:murein biosynthesis integral membrane protein MurJ n=1 Tax=Actinocorallia populi TaxID=2079200 RepID=UPI000D097791|nr:lipid II flippase MurJ [Actinocorallia populi]
MRRLASGIAGAALLIAVLTVLSRVAGFGRTAVFSQTVGASCLSDVYFTANHVPNIVFEIVAGGALASMVVPVLAGPVERGDTETVRRTASAMLTWVLMLLVPLALLVALLAGPIMALLSQGDLGGCDAAAYRAIGARMLVVFAPQIVMYGLAVVLYGVLQSHRRFTGPALAPLLSSLVMIGAYLAYVPLMGGHDPRRLPEVPRDAELVLSVGTTVGVSAMVVVALVAGWPLRLRLRPALRFPAGVGRQVRVLAFAGLATVVAQQLATLAILVLKNDGTRAALTHYTYAWAIYLLPWAILVVPVATSAFQSLSARFQDADPSGFDRIAASTTRVVVLVSCLGAALVVAVAVPVAWFFDPPGQSTDAQPEVLARALLAFAPGLLGYGLVAHLGRALYACDRGRESARAVVIGWVTVLVADVVLVQVVPKDWVVAAFGFGNAAGMSVAGALLLVALVRARGAAAVEGLPRAALGGLLGGSVGAAAGYSVARAFGVDGQVHNLLGAAAAALAAVIVFGALAAFTARDDLREILARRR